MHLFYYELCDYLYVYDQNHKLYQYPNKDGVKEILYLENTMNLLKVELNETDRKKFHFKYFEEFNAKENYACLEIAKMVSLLEYHHFSSIAPFMIIIEGIILNIINEDYKSYKNDAIKKDNYFEYVLNRTIKDLNNKIKELKENITVKELPLSCLDTYVSKTYLLNNPHYEYINHEINFEIQANFYPYTTFSNNIYAVNLDDVDNFEKNKIIIYRKLLEEYKEKYNKKINDKKDYNYFLNIRELIFHLNQTFLILPCLVGIINQIFNSNLLKGISKFIIIPFILEELIGNLSLFFTNEILETANDPTLSLHKEKKD